MAKEVYFLDRLIGNVAYLRVAFRFISPVSLFPYLSREKVRENFILKCIIFQAPGIV